jgi:uncharacterized protein (TIGR02145 family)
MKKVSILILIFALLSSCEKESNVPDGNNTPGNALIDPRDGKSYVTVKIGDQVWMAENMAYDGAGKEIEFNLDWGENSTYDGWCYYGLNQPKYGNAYGILYQWEIAKNVCPAGWHLPDNDEWKELVNYLGGDSIAGGRLKEKGTTHWIQPNYGATDSVGFSALPGGYRAYYGSNFGYMGYSAFFWSSAVLNNDTAYCWQLYHDRPETDHTIFPKSSGFSVRCVKDN